MDYPADVDKVPEKVGVYMFIDSSDEVVYVGKAMGTKLKDEIKAKNGADAAKGATKFRWFKTKSSDAAARLEADWIKRYHPKNNQIVK